MIIEDTSELEIPDVIETKRFILRPYQEGDGQMFFDMLEHDNRDHLQELLGLVASSDEIEFVEKWICDLGKDWKDHDRFVMGIWSKSTQDFLGHLWIEPMNWDSGHFEIGWFVDKNHQGKGIITEATIRALIFIFNNLNAHKVTVRVRENGPYAMKSKNIAERCGFIYEGLLRETIKLENGDYTSETYYGLLKSEFVSLEIYKSM